MAFKLSIVAGKGQGREFAFTHKVVRIGRQTANDLVLYDTSVSRLHCEIRERGETYVLYDLGSRNGTLVNERPAVEIRLDDGDRIHIGPAVFAFRRARVSAAAATGAQDVFAPPAAAARRAVAQQSTSFVPGGLDLVVSGLARAAVRHWPRAVAGGLRRLPVSTRWTLAAGTALVLAAALVALQTCSGTGSTAAAGEGSPVTRGQPRTARGLDLTRVADASTAGVGWPAVVAQAASAAAAHPLDGRGARAAGQAPGPPNREAP